MDGLSAIFVPVDALDKKLGKKYTCDIALGMPIHVNTKLLQSSNESDKRLTTLVTWMF